MNEFREGTIPIEYTKERPPVFESKKGWDLVRNFALLYGNLRGRPEIKDITSSLELIRQVEKSVGTNVSESLPKLLEDQGVSEVDQKVFLEAARSRNFANIDFKDKEKVITALGLSMVAEHARTQTMIEALNTMNEEELRVLDMTPNQRDVVTGLLQIFTSGNPEYIRFKTRAMTGEKYPERPVDAVREENRIAMGIKKVREKLIEKGAENVFGEAGPDFVEYLELYEKGYQPLGRKEEKPLTKKWREEKANRFRKAFEEFLAKHPEFPLILFPRGDKYVRGATELGLGRDPEIRLSWQSPELKQEAEQLINVRDRFIEYLERRFGKLLEKGDLERIKTNRPLIANDLGYFGIGMQFRFEAQELEGTSVIFENVQIENRVSTRKMLLELFGDDAKEIVNSPAFIELADAEMMIHEWGHQVHNPETKGAKNLGEAENGINEMKSDVLAYAALHDLLGEHSHELYGDQGGKALNMYMLGYALDGAKNMSPDSEERPYYISAIAILNRLVEASVIVQSEKGPVIDKEKLGENLSEKIFQPQAQEILEVYHDAENASGAELRQIRKRANELGDQTPHPFIQELIEKLKTEG